MQYANLAASLGIIGVIQGDEFRAKCPLHSDNSPSFSLNIEHGAWICHAGCGSGGFTSLVERVLSCSFQEARGWIDSNGRHSSVEQLSRQLAQEMGMIPGQPPVYQTSRQTWREHYESLSNNVIPLWFLERGFTWDTVNYWDIRYDPSTDGVVIPVKAPELVGTISRPRNGVPKYQNSPGLPRSEILFGEISSHEKSIIICEGVLDTIWLWQNGYNTAGLLGTYISQKQVAILGAYRFGEITLALDNDDAGKKGTQDTIQRLVSAGWLLPQIKIMKFPQGRKDPQDCTTEELAYLYGDRKDIFSDLRT